ncbi:hypothetical protein C1H46_027971 [Malus baccata]|uniref:TIR domain-containing protein n=1 Tax=Malus baccata TaxID=106549 RepID=A0A540LJL4_MALBA|nr:hypothetical protein C1H46_027971 [Malus baccata]
MDTSTALEASSSSSPSSSSTTTSSSSSPYDVFLSFSGEDTRKTFTDHLYWTMKDAGIDFFMEENESIRRGENISDKVKQIIEGSRVSVIVFSSRYADSIWCLEELVQIMECRRTLKQMVLPIFYDLSPSHGIGTFVQAFQKHRERFHEDTDIQEKIWRWTDALTEAAGLTVWVFETTNGYEGMFIREIIDEITRQLKSPTLVGIAFSELQRLHSPKLEDIDSTEHTDTASSGSSAKSSLSMSPLKKRCHEPDHSDSTSSKFPKRSISSAGLELANVLVTSPPLHQSWNAVLDQKQKLPPAADPNQKMALDISETKHSNTTIISFLTSPVTLHDQQAMVSFTPKNADFSLFEFLCGKNTPSFSVNELAINFFKLNLTNLDIWRKKLVESSKSSRIVITGHSFGGAVATLFTLWLLQSLDLSKAKRPLCITFGSPLIGDEQLRKCVLEFSTWSSCFLNVASINDPVPKVFLTSQGRKVEKITKRKGLDILFFWSNGSMRRRKRRRKREREEGRTRNSAAQASPTQKRTVWLLV